MSSLHVSCEGPLGILLQSMLGPKASGQLEAGSSVFLSSADLDLGVPMEFQQGSQATSRRDASGDLQVSFALEL